MGPKVDPLVHIKELTPPPCASHFGGLAEMLATIPGTASESERSAAIYGWLWARFPHWFEEER
jgi:hypothetical protein